jgi:hypothetical protein
MPNSPSRPKIYPLMVELDPEDLALLEAVRRRDKLTKAALVRQMIRGRARRLGINVPKALKLLEGTGAP